MSDDTQEPTGGATSNYPGAGESAWEAYQLEVAEGAAVASSTTTPADTLASYKDDDDDSDAESVGNLKVPSLPTLVATNHGVLGGGSPKKPSSSNTHQAKWEGNIRKLRAFKEKHGHANVPRGADKGLNRFVRKQRQNYQLLLEGKQSSLTVKRIQDLEMLGFQWSLKPGKLTALAPEESEAEDRMKVAHDMAKAATEKGAKAKSDKEWNDNLGQLKIYKERTGHFKLPYGDRPRGTKRPRAPRGDWDTGEDNPETIKLGKWVKRQRRYYATNKLHPERVAALMEIGFDFTPGNISKEDRLQIQLGLLDELRKRPELSTSQVQDLNYLYDQWKTHANDSVPRPVHVRKAQAENNKFHIKWQQQFEQLRQFQIKNGHTRVPQRLPPDDPLHTLGKWVDYQRQLYSRLQKGTKVPLTEDRIAQLESIGFEWRIRVRVQQSESSDIARGIAVLKDDDEVFDNLSSVFAQQNTLEGDNLNDQKWSKHLEELTRYKSLFGTTRIINKKHPVYGEQLASLAKWVERQRKLYKKRKSGEKSAMPKSRARRLEAIGFEFENLPGKPVDFRGWDERLNALKEFRLEHGHCRVPSHKKKDDPTYDPKIYCLAKWVEHQRSMYWKKAKGEKNSLSVERIAALNAVGMEWRVLRTVDDKRWTPQNNYKNDVIHHSDIKTAEENNVDLAEEAELSVAHQVIDAIPDSIPNLAPASVDVELEPPMEEV